MTENLKDFIRFVTLILAIFTAILVAGIYAKVTAQTISYPPTTPIIQEVVYQNQDLDMVVIYDFFGVNKLSCHSKTQPLMKVQTTVQGQIQPTAMVYPYSTVMIANYSQCTGKWVTCKYWKYQWPNGTGNTEWIYCGQFQFYVQ